MSAWAAASAPMFTNSAARLLPGLSLDGIGGEGLFGELTVGYDYMVSPRFLFGAFADAHYGNIETTLEIPAGGLDASVSDTYGFDAGVRAGYLFTPATLGYVLGGYAWQKAELDVWMVSSREVTLIGIVTATSSASAWKRSLVATGR